MIRPAGPDDVPGILTLVRELADYERSLPEVVAGEADLRESLFGPAPAAYAHVAVDGAGEVVGFALWFLSFSTWLGRHGIYLEDLYVRPTVRGQGYGRALLAELARLCLERGYGRLEWAVLDWNTPSREFYAAIGAVEMDQWTVHRLSGAPLARLGEAAEVAFEAEEAFPAVP